MLLVVAYDISDNRRRAKVHTLLLGYGANVQESLFECEVNQRQEAQLRQRLSTITRPAEDNVHFYRLCAECAGLNADLNGPRPQPAVAVVV
jgi:CRISPR-associated protein Cas2